MNWTIDEVVVYLLATTIVENIVGGRERPIREKVLLFNALGYLEPWLEKMALPYEEEDAREAALIRARWYAAHRKHPVAR